MAFLAMIIVYKCATINTIIYEGRVNSEETNDEKSQCLFSIDNM